jgi:hypothetical protein
MSDRDKFIKSCDDAPKFPSNLVYPNAYNHILVAYLDRLEKEDSRLFFDESKASLVIRDYDENVQGTRSWKHSRSLLGVLIGV